MALYAIGDLHLSFTSNKPMDIFGENWIAHSEKIKNNWELMITENDVVLIPGDISWASTLDEAMIDLKWLDDLPGQKWLLRGNHDYWWSSVTKMNKLFDSIHFLQNSYFKYKDYGICGTRGWDCPNEHEYTEHDYKIYNREQIRLKLSLDSAVKDKVKKLIVMTHYPPVYEAFETSDVTQILEEYNVEMALYGHVHTAFTGIVEGEYNNVNYRCVSSDYIDFKPVRILD